MGSVVPVSFFIGSASVSDRKKLNKICEILGIKDPPKSIIPLGATYSLFLDGSSQIPEKAAGMKKRAAKKRKASKKNG